MVAAHSRSTRSPRQASPNVYNIIDGFEGDKVAEEGSLYLGKRLKNGWKNSGSPWTYDGDPDLLWIEKED